MKKLEKTKIGLRTLFTALLLGIPTLSNATDFEQRCQAPGVLKCVGFDSPSDFVPAVYPDPGLYPVAGGENRATMDATIKASGNGSLRFEIVGGTGANPAGQWRQDFGRDFGENSTFYVQFRQRFSPEMLEVGSGFGGGGWKQVIFHDFAATCALLEITTNNWKYRKFPYMYTECGGRVLEFWSPADHDVVQQYSPPPPGPPGSDDYWCLYNPALNLDPNNRCAFYASNEWMTFYYEIKVGNWGQPNSSIKAWVGYEGQPLKLWINHPAFTLRQDAPDRFFDYLTLLPYDTGKDGRDHPTAYTWYDELIISTQPILAPDSGVVNQPPAAPTALSVN